METLTEKQRIDIKTVMLATDLTVSSRLALSYAVGFAKRFEAELVTLNAFQFGVHSANVEEVDHIPSRTRRDAESKLAAFSSVLEQQGIRSKSELIEGPVPATILQAVKKDRADLLVLGTEHIHQGLSHVLSGSKTEILMLNAPCPTLTIGPRIHQEWKEGQTFREVLYISNLSPQSEAATPFVQALATNFGATVEVIRIGVESSTNHVAEDLKAVIESRDPLSLVSVGVEPGGFIRRHLHTSLAYELLMSIRRPVLTIPLASAWLTDRVKGILEAGQGPSRGEAKVLTP